MKVRAPLQALQKEAFRVRYPLLLRKEMVKEQLQAGRMATHHWRPVEIVDEFKQCMFDPHEYMYGHLKGHMSHEDDGEDDEAYGTSSAEEKTGTSPRKRMYRMDSQSSTVGNVLTIYPEFTHTDRIKLIQSQLEGTPLNDHCCGLDLRHLRAADSIAAVFPIQNLEEKLKLENEWLQTKSLWRQPVELIRAYLGEKIGLYFAFLSHYNYCLGPAALVGVVMYAIRAWTKASRMAYTFKHTPTEAGVEPSMFDTFIFVPDLWFALAMAIWSSCFTESWKRKEKTLAMQVRSRW